MTANRAILFVCLGNICRSPLAEAAFRDAAERAGLAVAVDSAGTGDWHVGNPPDRRAQATALRHGIDISGYRARQVRIDDFRRYDDIFALDAENLANLRRIAPRDATARLSLLMDVVPGRSGEPGPRPLFRRRGGLRNHLVRRQRRRRGPGRAPVPMTVRVEAKPKLRLDESIRPRS